MLNKNIQSIEKIQLELSDCFKTFELKFTKYVRLDIRIFFIFNFKYLSYLVENFMTLIMKVNLY